MKIIFVFCLQLGTFGSGARHDHDQGLETDADGEDAWAGDVGDCGRRDDESRGGTDTEEGEPEPEADSADTHPEKAVGVNILAIFYRLGRVGGYFLHVS